VFYGMTPAKGERILVPIRQGPARYAVLVYRGKRLLIARVLECLEYAHANGLVGAIVTCLGPREPDEKTEPCATTVAFDWARATAVEP
jgi:hypothetical protein